MLTVDLTGTWLAIEDYGRPWISIEGGSYGYGRIAAGARSATPARPADAGSAS